MHGWVQRREILSMDFTRLGAEIGMTNVGPATVEP